MATKLRRIIIGTLVGTFVLLVAMIVAWNMVLLRPLRDQKTTLEGTYTTEVAEAAKLADALASRKQAQDDKVLLTEQLQEMRSRYRNFNFNVTDANVQKVTWQNYTNELSTNFGVKLRRQLIEAADRSGIRLTASVKVDAPPQVPENVVVPNAGFLKPVTGGSMKLEAEGSFANYLTFFDEINRPVPDPLDRSPRPQPLNILFLVGSDIKFEGYSPNIKSTFTVTPFLIAQGKSVALNTPPQPGPGAPAAAAPADGANPDGQPPAPT